MNEKVNEIENMNKFYKIWKFQSRDEWKYFMKYEGKYFMKKWTKIFYEKIEYNSKNTFLHYN